MIFDENILKIYRTLWDMLGLSGLLKESVSYTEVIWGFIVNWWWLILPIILLRPFLFLWLWWREEIWLASLNFVLLEIKIPKEVLKPLRAMEQVFSSFWGAIYDPPDWWEKWVEGKRLLRLSFEMVSIEGQPHFFIRIPQDRQQAIESAIYAQYPDSEISVVDDYTKYVPQDIPNRTWELWACDYQMLRPDVYPIKTYARFFEERPEVTKEEKRLDPISTLLEGMAKFGKDEHLWVQIFAKPISKTEDDYEARGRKIADKIARRKPEAGGRSAIVDAIDLIVLGRQYEEEKKEEIIPPEMKLTPGEREILSSIEEKIGKYMFETYIRFIYLAKRDVYSGGAKAIPFSFFQQFATANLNAIIPATATITKIKKSWFLPLNYLLPRRLYIRKRRIFRYYIKRLPPLYPFAGLTFLFNIEELATIFHFPGRTVAPAPFVPRVEVKRGEAPPGLPVE